MVVFTLLYIVQCVTSLVFIMVIIYQTNKKPGITYAYNNEPSWDKEKQQSRAKVVQLAMDMGYQEANADDTIHIIEQNAVTINERFAENCNIYVCGVCLW